LLFECVVAKRAWQIISQVLCKEVGIDYESVARLWLCNKKHGITNMVTSTVSWSIWKLRNTMIFQGVAWLGMKQLWQRVVPMVRCWRVSGDGTWLRKYHFSAGKGADNAGGDRILNLTSS
jgi:hypothetical protein